MLPELPGLPLEVVFSVGKLPSSFLAVHRDWLVSQQHADGGFSGRAPNSCLYYSAFGGRLLALIGCTEGSQWVRLADFLKGRISQIDSLVDLESAVTLYLLTSVFAERVEVASLEAPLKEVARNMLNTLQREDGGYARNARSAAGSTYSTFLSIMIASLLGLSLPKHEQLVRFFLGRQRPDGGFAELPFLKDSGTNPTAAAVIALAQIGQLEQIESKRVLSFLRSVHRADGGFAASVRAPISDLLSTCSALVALTYLARRENFSLNWQQIREYDLSLADPEGGFYAHRADDQRDVEYTFYGILSLGAVGFLESSLAQR